MYGLKPTGNPSSKNASVLWLIDEPWLERGDGSVATTIGVRDHLVPHLHSLRQAGIAARVATIDPTVRDEVAQAGPGAHLIFSHTRSRLAETLLREAALVGARTTYFLPLDLRSGELDRHHFLMAGLADQVTTESVLEQALGASLIPATWLLALPRIRHANRNLSRARAPADRRDILVVAFPGSEQGRSELSSVLARLDYEQRRKLRIHVLFDVAVGPGAMTSGSSRYMASRADLENMSAKNLNDVIEAESIALTIFTDCQELKHKKRIRRLRDQLIWVGHPAVVLVEGAQYRVTEDLAVRGFGKVYRLLENQDEFRDLFNRAQGLLRDQYERNAIEATIVRHRMRPRLPDNWRLPEPSGSPPTQRARASTATNDGVETVVIVLGAHRSGTSLVSQILSVFGVHMGGDGDDEQFESAAFRQINEWLLDGCGATWDQPARLVRALSNPRCFSIGVRLARILAKSSFLARYWGGPNAAVAATARPRMAGWKDPRNSVTWPIWLCVFPHARFVVVEREPFATAKSLVRRHHRVLYEMFPSGSDNVTHSQLCFVHEDIKVTERCFSICGALELIGEHRTAIDEAAKALADRLFVIAFDELTEQPRTVIADLAAFLGLSTLPEGLTRAVSLVGAKPKGGF
jgi:hypothetical protein